VTVYSYIYIYIYILYYIHKLSIASPAPTIRRTVADIDNIKTIMLNTSRKISPAPGGGAVQY